MSKVFDTELLKREYKDKFPEDWLESEDWSEGKEKESYIKCKNLIDSYSELFLLPFHILFLVENLSIRKKR